MKHTIILAMASLAMLASCNNFLDEDPKDQIPVDKAYTDASSIYLNAVANLYNYTGGYSDGQGLQGTYRGVYDLNTFTTDEAIIPTRGGDWYDGGFWQQLYLHTWGKDNAALLNAWNYLYKVIVLSNASLETIEAKDSLLTAAQHKAYTAEVRAIRAMYYYYLVDLFGRVPLVVSSSTPMRDVSQSTRSQVFRFVVDELQESLPYLPAKRSNQPGNYYGRLTRPVAFFLLAKLALNAEVYTDDNWTDSIRPDGKQIYFSVGGRQLNAWQTVEAYCDSLTAMGYALTADMADNFSVFNESSTENIFTIPMDPASYTNQMQNLFRSYHYRHASAYGFTGENGSSATLEALRTFAYGTDSVDRRFSETYYADTLRDLQGRIVTLQNGDTLCYYPWDIALVLTGTPHMATAGARMHKYAVDLTATKDGKLMNNDIVLYRYADALLMKCEAQVRNGEDGSAILHQIRSRSGMPDRPATLDNILRERMLELAWEGWRRQDLIRFGQYTRAYSFRPQLSNEANGYTTVFPIPGTILERNTKLHQNYGYDD